MSSNQVLNLFQFRCNEGYTGARCETKILQFEVNNTSHSTNADGKEYIVYMIWKDLLVMYDKLNEYCIIFSCYNWNKCGCGCNNLPLVWNFGFYIL